MLPETRYASLQGLRIAYQVLGERGPHVVLSAGSFNHCEVQWEDPAVAVFLRRVAGFSRLVRFDMLGVGGSDRWPDVSRLPSFGTQLEAVLETVGAREIALIALLDGGFGAVEFAVHNPDRISHLILCNATARMRRDVDYEIGLDEPSVSALLRLLDQGWGTPAMAAANVPSRADDERFVEWYSKYLRSVGTPTEVTRSFALALEADVRELLPQVAARTLVMHRRDFALVPVTHGIYLAEKIPDAEYAELHGADGPLFWEAADLVLRRLEMFILGSEPAASSSRAVLALLFTDIAESTRRAGELGDRDWMTVLAQHDEICARHAAHYGGWVVKGTGDGVLAGFPSPSDALLAASAIREELGRMSVMIRGGIHAGEVERSGADVSGLAVHIAARVMAEAEPGEILVSRTVRDLLGGSRFRFADAGLRPLKGIAEPWHLYRLDRPED